MRGYSFQVILTIQRKFALDLLPLYIVKLTVSIVNFYCSDTLSLSMEEREKLARIEPQTVKIYIYTH